MKWTRLKDKKPEDGHVVLFWNAKMLRQVVGYLQGDKINYVCNFHIVPNGDTLPWDLNGTIAPIYPNACSHWMPIPQVPEECLYYQE